MQPEYVAQYENALIAFVLRARRVAEHSLARDTAALGRWMQPTWKMKRGNDSKVITRTELPPEEQVESAAARLRPLLLTKEPTYHPLFMNALLYFADKAGYPPDSIAALKGMKQAWEGMNPRREAPRNYSTAIVGDDGVQVEVSDTYLGFAWLNGDSVHADAERRQRTERFGVKRRYKAAVHIVINLIILTKGTLREVRILHDRGHLPFLDAAFAEEVVVKDLVEEQEGYVGDGVPFAGMTFRPDLLKMDEWTTFTQNDFMLGGNDPKW